MMSTSVMLDRILPKPEALLHPSPDGSFPRRSSFLAQHHIVPNTPSSHIPRAVLDGRGSVVASPESVKAPKHRLTTALPPVVQRRQETTPSPVNEDQTTTPMVEETSRQPSPSSQTDGIGLDRFCLCQPDPKIPRPRNGTRDEFGQWHKGVKVDENSLPMVRTLLF